MYLVLVFRTLNDLHSVHACVCVCVVHVYTVC